MLQVMGLHRPLNVTARVVLPWGLPLTFDTSDHIGAFILHHGVYDLCVTEAVWRLTDPGETVLDVGANIGYMTSLMARRVGLDGIVHAFEPHPDIIRDLDANVKSWPSPPASRVELHQVALSDCDREGILVDAVGFDTNRGISFIGEDEHVEAGTTHDVPLRRLDGMSLGSSSFGVMKLDVEGHEEAVLVGAERMLNSGQIRDIVFEDHFAMPSSVARLLESHGYTVFRLRQRTRGLVVTPLDRQALGNLEGPPNFVATRDPQRVVKRLSRPGWAALRGSSS